MRRHFRPIVLLLLAAHSLVMEAIEDEYPDATNATVTSNVLNKLVDPNNYDKRLRPRYGQAPVDVGITIHVIGISAVSEVNMDFTLDFYLRQMWIDPRLAFDKMDVGRKSKATTGKLKELTVGVDYLERLWKPDTFFPNEKKAYFHSATTHNSFLRIDPNGQVFTSQRLTVTATCAMVLQMFPMDSQKCHLELESYGYPTADIDYFWGENREWVPIKAVGFGEISLPQFALSGYFVNSSTSSTSTGNYVRLYFEILLSRSIGFYMMNIFVPSILIVCISWVSFWVNREASPARTTLGVTTVLTMTTLMTTTNASMPKVSYVKAIDFFLGFCFVMVFASLLEFAAVSYLNKRLAKRRERRRKKVEAEAADQKKPLEYQMFSFKPTPVQTASNTPLLQSERYAPIVGRYSPLRVMHVPGSGPCGLSGHQVECDCDLLQKSSKWPAPFGKPKRPKRTTRFTVTPSMIDKYSRAGFPLLFLCFNVIYWSVALLVRHLESEKWSHFATVEKK